MCARQFGAVPSSMTSHHYSQVLRLEANVAMFEGIGIQTLVKQFLGWTMLFAPAPGHGHHMSCFWTSKIVTLVVAMPTGAHLQINEARGCQLHEGTVHAVVGGSARSPRPVAQQNHLGPKLHRYKHHPPE